MNNQFYNNVSNTSCLCRSPGQNCTCCLTAQPATPPQPVCPAVSNNVLPSCMCTISQNGTQTCDCKKNLTGITSFYYGLKFNSSLCSCVSITQNGIAGQMCQCCASSAQVAPAQPVCSNSTSQQCTCANSTDASGNTTLTCDCQYAGSSTIIRGLNQSVSNCGCPNNNALSRQCSCCVNTQSIVSAMTPTC